MIGDQRYYPFGETRLLTGTMYTDRLFTGQREMTASGIYYYGARYYSPKLGRFLSADTVVPSISNPQALNRYSYVLNNPIRFNDPSGYKACDSEGAGSCTISSEPITLGQVVSRLRHYGVKTSGKWSFGNLFAAFAGVDMIAQKLAQTIGSAADVAFKQVYKSVNFHWADGVCGGKEDRCYADANSFPTINFYSKWYVGEQDENGHNLEEPSIVLTPAVTPELAIHELGHGFDSRTDRAFNQAAINKGITDKTGFGVTVGATGQHEVTADLFTNYILGAFTGPGKGGVNLLQFMNTNIATWINLASAP